MRWAGGIVILLLVSCSAPPSESASHPPSAATDAPVPGMSLVSVPPLQAPGAAATSTPTPPRPAPTQIRWAVDSGSADSRRSWLVFFLPVGTFALSIVDPREDHPCSVQAPCDVPWFSPPIADPTRFGPEACASAERDPGQAIAVSALDNATIDAFVQRYQGLRAFMRFLHGGEARLDLVDSACRGAGPDPSVVPARAGSDASLPQWSAAPGVAACRTIRDPRPPAGSICVTVTTGDLDGDGVPDRVVVWGDPGPPRAQGSGHLLWHLAAMTARGLSDEIVLETVASEAAVRGIIDVNGDGHGQILVRIGETLSSEIWSTFAFVDGKVKPIESVTGIPLWVNALGSDSYGGRFDCVTDANGARSLSTVRFVARNVDPYGEVLDWAAAKFRIAGAFSIQQPGGGFGTVTRAEVEDPASDFSRRWPAASASAIAAHCGLRLQGD